jgi:hypothetical protein
MRRLRAGDGWAAGVVDGEGDEDWKGFVSRRWRDFKKAKLGEIEIEYWWEGEADGQVADGAFGAVLMGGGIFGVGFGGLAEGAGEIGGAGDVCFAGEGDDAAGVAGDDDVEEDELK